MWRKLYLALVFVRLYFAFGTSYIHPDEHFQGPEIIAGHVFGWVTSRTWEFTSSQPIRSLFPLWLIYGPPLIIVKWIWEGLATIISGDTSKGPPPDLAFYALRLTMFAMSFVLEDWALHELIPSSRPRRTAILLVASSYVTWTFQTHTFSNSVETLIALWCLVLMGRIRNDQQHTQVTACVVLAFLGVLGVFNRITFPAFIVVPGLQLLPHLFRKPLRIAVILLSALAVLTAAVVIDTQLYTPGLLRLRDLPKAAVLTPWNNLTYNLNPENLASHGLHPFYQHFLINLPQLIGPTMLLLPLVDFRNSLLWTAVTGTAILSCFRHQEARFLLPAVPLYLASIRLPKVDSTAFRAWLVSWILFNFAAALLFGIYHQGGVVPTQLEMEKYSFDSEHSSGGSEVFWWKTYSPPHWLQGLKNEKRATVDLMGLSGPEMIGRLNASAPGDLFAGKTFLVAPASATFLDPYVNKANHMPGDLVFSERWRFKQHVGLDDLDFGDDGVMPTLRRVFGRKGLVTWHVHRE